MKNKFLQRIKKRTLLIYYIDIFKGVIKEYYDDDCNITNLCL